MALLAPPRIAFPDATGLFQDMPAESAYITNLTARVTQEIEARTRDDTARPSMMLQSPGGSVYAVYVDDAGTLSTAKVR